MTAKSNSHSSLEDVSVETRTDSVDDGEPFNYDDVLKHIGQMGKYQRYTFLLLCLPALFPGIIVMSYTFTGGIPNYRCYIEGCDHLDSLTSSSANDFCPAWLNNTVPWNDNNQMPDECYRYNQTWANLNECHNDPVDFEAVEQCQQWVYDRSMFKSSIVTDFDLTCDNEWKQTLASSVYMFGQFIGGATVGSIADRIGRRLAFTLNVLALASATTGLAFSPNIIAFCILRFLCGFFAVGHFLILFVWGVEAVGRKYRVMCGFVYQLIFTVGSALLGLIAFYVREWQTLQLIISVPMFALVSLYWIVPESIRWLITKKRYSEAHQLILKAAETNRQVVPKHLLTVPDGSNGQNVRDNQDGRIGPAVITNLKKESILDVFRSLVLCKRLIIMILAWIAGVMGYYGITFSATNLSSSFYLNYELSMIVEFPAYIGGIFVMDKLGRRPSLSGGLILSGLACLVTGVVPAEPAAVRLTFSLIGKLFISGVMATLYSYTSDLFPTPARTAAVGLCSASGRIGGMLAPVIAHAGRKVNPALPFIVFASVNISVGLLCLLLPETNKITLPATIREAEAMERFTFSCLQCNMTKDKQHNDEPETRHSFQRF